MRDYKIFIKAYNEVKKNVDPNKRGILPDLSRLVCYILMGIPPVPADEYDVPEALEIAIEQRIAILKAIFVEINKDEPEEFIDKGLNLYDTAGRMAKELLKDNMSEELSEFLDKHIAYYSQLDDYDLI